VRLLLVSDAWFPQVNGVVRTMSTVKRELESAGHAVEVVSPDRFATCACPTDRGIRLALRPKKHLVEIAEAFDPDRIHVVTEGPLGLAARSWCVARGLPFTTAFHTRFPETLRARLGLPVALGYRALRWFHSAATRTLVSTPILRRELESRGFRNLAPWSRGVDCALFRPGDKSFLDLPRPVHLYVGRVAVEKSVDHFLRLPLEGSKLVVGDGPDLATLRARFPDAHFVGMKSGSELSAYYAASDVFVFPSRTDTFGLVLLEALASGLPVAALPVPGPLDVITSSAVGVLDDDLASAARRALALDPDACRAFALERSWTRCAAQFAGYLEPVEDRARRRALPVKRVPSGGGTTAPSGGLVRERSARA
jgi:glycosyltransferase involved in cell wall biosynthesis